MKAILISAVLSFVFSGQAMLQKKTTIAMEIGPL